MPRKKPRKENAPSAFISYSWDSRKHRGWVIALATKLREKGIDVTLDYWHLSPGADKLLFMEQAVAKSDHVLLICTPNFKKKAEGRLGGVGWEASIVTGELANDLMQTKFIPILREGGSFSNTLPRWLINRVGIDLRGDTYSDDEFERLLRALHNEVIGPPPVGPRPIFRENDKASSESCPASNASCDFSPRALLISTELSLKAFPLVQESNWSEEIEIAVSADTSEIDSVFSRFRGHKGQMVVAYGFDVAIARLKSLNRVGSGGTATWKAKFQPTRTEFCNDMETGTSSTSADQFAERRVRRLLLNENPMAFKSDKDDAVGFLNEAMTENLVQGLNSIVKIERSGFIDLHKDFGLDPQKFIEIAWISAVADLKLSASIEHINHLRLQLSGDVISVDFSGCRHRKYVNVDPYQINVKGSMVPQGTPKAEE